MSTQDDGREDMTQMGDPDSSTELRTRQFSWPISQANQRGQFPALDPRSACCTCSMYASNRPRAGGVPHAPSRRVMERRRPNGEFDMNEIYSFTAEESNLFPMEQDWAAHGPLLPKMARIWRHRHLRLSVSACFIFLIDRLIAS